jgi:hypothetical protein
MFEIAGPGVPIQSTLAGVFLGCSRKLGDARCGNEIGLQLGGVVRRGEKTTAFLDEEGSGKNLAWIVL